LKPDYARAYCNLGEVLEHQGQLAEALAARRRGHAIGSTEPNWPYPSAQWVRHAERLVELDGQLPALLKGTAQPAAADLLVLADLCARCKRLNTAGARFYRDAFAAEPARADDLKAGYRYRAARAAALAAVGQGEDAAVLDDKERSRWRQQALAWL